MTADSPSSLIIAADNAHDEALSRLKRDIKQWGVEAGFQQCLISDVDLSDYQAYYQQWLEAEHHGQMSYMQRNVEMRLQPELLQQGCLRSINFRMDYLPHSQDRQRMETLLGEHNKAYISRYALGRDYHKLIRKRLAAIATQIQQQAKQQLQQRAFVDSAPVLERALAEKSGMGWIGKNTMLINKKAGSYFFLAEILTDLPLAIDVPESHQQHCGSCRACLDVCPTNAFKGPNELDARRCISYLTIELQEAIPEDLRPLMGNRIYGCDDCQIFCPWNKFNQATEEQDFSPRHQLDDVQLLDLFHWTEQEFLDRTAGSAIRRIGFQRWIRNIAVALGNADKDQAIQQALSQRLMQDNIEPMVKEHIRWALTQQSQA